MKHLVSMDFFAVPTATFRVLFVIIVLSHDRRRVLHFNVTDHPTEELKAQQMREAFPWDEAPKYLIRDRDAIFGGEFVAMTKSMGIEEVVTAPRSPWPESICGTTDRIHSPRVPGSRHRLEPEIVAADPAKL